MYVLLNYLKFKINKFIIFCRSLLFLNIMVYNYILIKLILITQNYNFLLLLTFDYLFKAYKFLLVFSIKGLSEHLLVFLCELRFIGLKSCDYYNPLSYEINKLLTSERLSRLILEILIILFAIKS